MINAFYRVLCLRLTRADDDLLPDLKSIRQIQELFDQVFDIDIQGLQLGTAIATSHGS